MEIQTTEHRGAVKRRTVLAGIGIATLAFAIGIPTLSQERQPDSRRVTNQSERREPYVTHHNITATIFWVGEAADDTNDFIHNSSSAWVENWQAAYGGVDDPNNRCNHLPCGFTPQENPFYFALPYNDLDDNGKRKASAKQIPWYQEVIDNNPTSVVKNRWIKVTLGDKTAYAQWEDAGPFEYDDFDYVFGDKNPRSDRAALDLSPATASLLGLNGRANVSWQFVEESDIPDGPWKKTITRSN